MAFSMLCKKLKKKIVLLTMSTTIINKIYNGVCQHRFEIQSSRINLFDLIKFWVGSSGDKIIVDCVMINNGRKFIYDNIFHIEGDADGWIIGLNNFSWESRKLETDLTFTVARNVQINIVDTINHTQDTFNHTDSQFKKYIRDFWNDEKRYLTISVLNDNDRTVKSVSNVVLCEVYVNAILFANDQGNSKLNIGEENCIFFFIKAK